MFHVFNGAVLVVFLVFRVSLLFFLNILGLQKVVLGSLGCC